MAVLYRKLKNTNLFKDFEDEDKLNVCGAQNYIPIYTRFFELNATNWQNVSLYHLKTLSSVQEKKDKEKEKENVFIATLVDDDQKEETAAVFFKYSPLLDPNKYMTGAYSLDEALPRWGDSTANKKLLDENNAAYTDSFFYYLSSRLKHKGFEHGIDFYGSYLGYKKEFKYFLDEDAECICNDTFFKKNLGQVFKTNVQIQGKLKKLDLGEECSITEDCLIESDYVEVILDENGYGIEKREKVEKVEEVQVQEVQVQEVQVQEVQVQEMESEEIDEDKSVSTNSSRSSNSSDGTTESYHGSESTDESRSYDGVDDAYAIIAKFPVQIIAIEACEDTLDSLLDKISPEELASCLCQVVMSLILYQKAYAFTHNDLHTNNIMYVSTDKPFLYYFVNETAYKVPTFGKIYKIIDFGRSIYTFEEKRFMSDSFSSNGDASTQYNCEPYFNPLKPCLEPNYSFDLCRLACSMIDMMPEKDEYDELNQLLDDWCSDDKGRNVVYKRNGEERYPGFKLYKMIARTVHNNTPLLQLRRPIFQKYVVKKKALKNVSFMDLDSF